MDNISRFELLIEEIKNILQTNEDRVFISIHMRRETPKAEKEQKIKQGTLPTPVSFFNFEAVSLDDYQSFIIDDNKRQRGRPINPVYSSLVDKLKKHRGRVCVDIKHFDLIQKRFKNYQYAVSGECIYIDATASAY